MKYSKLLLVFYLVLSCSKIDISEAEFEHIEPRIKIETVYSYDVSSPDSWEKGEFNYKRVKKYSYEGFLLEQTHYSPTATSSFIYTFTDDYKRVSIKRYVDGEETSYVIDSAIREFNFAGDVIRFQDFKEGIRYSDRHVQYYRPGLIQSWTYHNGDGSLNGWDEYFYDDQENMILNERININSPETVQVLEYEYDEFGNETRAKFSIRTPTQTNVSQDYIFINVSLDMHNNWSERRTKRNLSGNKDHTTIIERELEYY